MRGMPGKIAAVLLLTGTFGIGALELDASLSARRDLARLLARNPGVRVAGIVAEPLAGRVTLLGVSFGSGSQRLTIGALHLPLSSAAAITRASASPFDDAPAAPQTPAPATKAEAPAATPAPQATPVPVAGSNTASAENIVIVSGSTTYRLKRIDMTGTTLTSTDLAALLDTKNPATLETRLRKLTAAAIVIPEIISEDATPGSERRATLEQILLAGVNGGKIAAGSASGATFSIKDPQNAIDGTVGTMEATSVDLAQIVHVLGSVRTDEAEPILPLYASIVVNGAKLTNTTKNATLSFGSMKESGAKARALKTDLMAAAKAGAPASDPKSAALFDDMAHSFVIDSIELNDVETRSAGPDGADTFGFTRAAILGFGDAKVGGASLRGVHFLSGKGGKIGIGTIESGPMVLPTTRITEANAPATSAMVPPTGKVDIADIDVDIPASDVAASTKPPSDEPPEKTGPIKFKVAHLGLASDGLAGQIPKKSTVAVDNLSFDLLADPASTGKPFYEMGYRHIDVSAGLASTYESAANALTIDKLTFKGPNMGSLDLGLKLGNVTNGLISSNKEIAQASLIAIVVKAVDLTVVNDGLFEKAIAWKAKNDGISPDQERALGVDFVTNGLPALVNNNAKGKMVGAAIAAFITDPKSLHLSITSQNGVGIAAMGMLGTPDVLLDMLDIHADANK